MRFAPDAFSALLAAKASMIVLPLGSVLVIAGLWKFLQGPELGLAERLGIIALPSVLLLYGAVMVPRAMESIGKELRGLSVELKAMRNKVDEQDRGRDQAVDRLVEKIEHSFELLSARLGQRDPPPSA